MQRKTKSVRAGSGGELGATAVGAAGAIDNLAAVWDAVDKLQPDVLAVKPAGSFTIEEYVKRYNCPRRTAEGRLESALKQGNLLRVKVCLPDRAGRMTGQWCYSIAGKVGK